MADGFNAACGLLLAAVLAGGAALTVSVLG